MNFKQLISSLILAAPVLAHGQNSYWQQKVDNDISVTLDDKAHMLRGNINITYQNNSPDTLKFIYMHLYPNAYSSDRTAYEKQSVENGKTQHYFSSEEDRGFIDSLKFTVTNDAEVVKQAGVVETQDRDVIRLILPEPLTPGAKINIETPFRVKLPFTFSRLGHNKQSYQVSQWFPKPAVYDKKGWHPMPYLDQGEFYSEFGSYIVAVTLPENYVIMGTGNIREQKEKDWLADLSKLPAPALKDSSVIASSEVLKTVTFEENNVHDFAWFADKKWVVRQDTVTVPGTDNVVTLYTCFVPRRKDNWSTSLASVKKAILSYSEAVGPYPYRTAKAVQGPLSAGGGMEYPTVTIISADIPASSVEVSVVHEIGHNWFYGMLGSNERNYPWMDESINSFYEHKFSPAPSVVPWIKSDLNYMSYAVAAAANELVPADTAAAVMPEYNYASDVYDKASFLFAWLESYMGKEHFSEAMKAYFQSWQYKHPQPEDFRAIFEQHSDKNLSWFFDEAMHSTRPVDFAIGSIHKRNGLEVTVRNRSGLKAPALVTVFPGNGKDSVSVWTEPFTGNAVVTIPGVDDYDKVKIADIIPDYNVRNNENRSPFKLKALVGFNMEPKTKVWLSPALGFNYNDGFGAGILLHNLTVPQNKFQFALAPLYSFGSKTFNGTGFIGKTFQLHSGILHDVQFTVSGKTFSFYKTDVNSPADIHARYSKVAPELVFNFRKPTWRSPVERSLSLKAYWIREEQVAFNLNPVDSLFYPSKDGYEDLFYGKATYRHVNSRTFNPFSYTLEGQLGKQFAKLSLEANLRVDYFQKNKALYIRGYAGKFFNFADNKFDAYRYRIANTYSGQNDYLYDETYIGRNQQSGTWSQQISMKEGGFKINTLQYASQLGLSDNWLFALNLKTDIPYLWNLPIRFFLDIGTFANAKQMNPSGAAVLYDAGIEIYLGDYCSVYLPMVMSKDFSEYTKSVYPENTFLKTVSFSLDIGRINWAKLPGKILKM